MLLQMVATPKSRIYFVPLGVDGPALSFLILAHRLASIALPATGFQHVDVVCEDHVHNTNVCVSSVVVTTTYFRRAKSNVPTLTQNNLLEAIWQNHLAVMRNALWKYHRLLVHQSPPTCMVTNGRDSSVREPNLNRQNQKQNLTQMAHFWTDGMIFVFHYTFCCLFDGMV